VVAGARLWRREKGKGKEKATVKEKGRELPAVGSD
jgi:hypothetical protein